MAGKCPSCQKAVTRVTIEKISAATATMSWKGVSYICPLCRTIISVQIDPVALKTDTVNEVLKGLRK